MKFLALLITFLPTLLMAQSSLSLNESQSYFNWRKFSLSYMSFFEGPGLADDQGDITPNALGKPSDDGLMLNNNFSLRYFLNDHYALDFQARTNWVMNNATETEDFKAWRWQSPRFGISTTFFKTENSKLTGALNSDLPYYFPEPIGGGFIAEQRTTLATPGFFAKYTYTPLHSKWSLFSLVQPRYYIYRDRNVAEPQYSRAGFSPRLKNELTLSFSPSANYSFTDRFSFRLGTEFIYKKLIASDWNPFHGTQRAADPESKAWRLQAIPLQTGFNYIFSKHFEISFFVQGYPIADQRIDKLGNQAKFEETLSVGAWLSGTIF
jgi:hypothetical protein